jgi:hypothetical protein
MHASVALDYAECPDIAALAANTQRRFQAILYDPRYAPIRRDGRLDDQ